MCKTFCVLLRKQFAHTDKRNIKVCIANVLIAKKFRKLDQNGMTKSKKYTYMFNIMKYWKGAKTTSIKIIQYKYLLFVCKMLFGIKLL